MTFTEILQIVSPYLTLAGLIIFTIVFVWLYKTNGGAAAAARTDQLREENLNEQDRKIKLLTERVQELSDALDKERAASQKERNEMSAKIGKLEGALEEKEKQIAILQGRNPEIDEILKKLSEALNSNNPQTVAATEYMKAGREFMKQTRDYMMVSLPIIQELKDYIEKNQIK